MTSPLKSALAPAPKRKRSDGATGFLFALPHLVLFCLFVLAPLIYGGFISLFRWHILAKVHPFVGLGNYSAALSDDVFWIAVRNTVLFVVLMVPMGNLVSLGLALGLSSVKRFGTFYKIAFYLPVVISIAVVVVLWRWILNTEIGLLNVFLGELVNGLRGIGVPRGRFEPLPWGSSPAGVMPSLALLTMWWTAGGNMGLYLAGLNNISADYYEAASIDGANGWQKFWGITWPLLRPTTLFCLVISVLGAFQVFGQSYVLFTSVAGGPVSGPARSGLTMALYMYLQGFRQYQIGYGVAIGYLLFAIILVLTLVQFRLLSARDEAKAGLRGRHRAGQARARLFRTTDMASHVWTLNTSFIMRFLQRSQLGLHLPMMLVALLFLAPLGWMISTAFKAPSDIISGLGTAQWIPNPATGENFDNVLGKAEEFPIWRWTFNSFFVSLAATFLVLTVDSLAAFAYSRLQWRGRNTLFSILVATMLVPGQVLLIPTYLLVRKLGLFDTYGALIFPVAAGAFGVFLLRQFFMAIPKELEEAARLDGCGPLGILRHVILPLSKPALATLGIFTFMGTWNAFEGPLLFTDSTLMRTLPVGITIFQGRYNIEYGPMMAAAALAAIPVTVAGFFF